MPKVTFQNEIVTVDVPAGTTLLDAAQKAGVDVFRGLWSDYHCPTFPFSSYGSCNRCKVWVTGLSPDAVNPRTRKEIQGWRVNGALPAIGNQRLACQVVVQGDVEVRTRAGGPPRAQTTEWLPDPARANKPRPVVEAKPAVAPAPAAPPAAPTGGEVAPAAAAPAAPGAQ